jgi:hypothetical protein
MVPNISDQPAHFLNAEWTIRDGYFFRKFPILGEILSYVIISGLTPHSGTCNLGQMRSICAHE